LWCDFNCSPTSPKSGIAFDIAEQLPFGCVKEEADFGEIGPRLAIALCAVPTGLSAGPLTA
jgi:hypothetical protein